MISWSEPIDNGAIVTDYIVSIQQKDGQFTVESVYCVSNSANILSSKSCEVPLTTLYTAPYLLDGGSSVYAKVLSKNAQGASEFSDPGNGANIVFVPDPPKNLQDDTTITSETQIGLKWIDGASNGGMAVIDYTIRYD